MIFNKRPSIRIIILSLTLLLMFSNTNYVRAEIIPTDRLVSWDPGVPGGIPSYPVFADVTQAPYNAVGDGIADDTAAIQDALDDCPAGRAVFLPTGIYRVHSTLYIRKGIVLRGAGSHKTLIRNESSSTGNVILMRASAYSGGATADIIDAPSKGDTEIVVDSSAGFSPGDYVIVSQVNDPDLVDIEGCTWCGSRAMSQILPLSSLSENTLVLGRPLYFTLSSSLEPRVSLIDSILTRAGVEDLYLERFSRSGSYSDTNMIEINNAAECWIRNVVSYKAVGAHVRMQGTFRCEVRDSYFHHGHSYDGGRAYGVFLFGRNSDNLLENNIFYYLRHSMVLEAGGSGNVFGYNYSARMFDANYPDTDWLMSDVSTHGAHPFMNLFEGNIIVHLDFDNVWGSSSHNTVFRNHISRYSEGENETVDLALWAVEVQANNYYENVVGNVLCESGCQGVVDPLEPMTTSTRSIWRIGYNGGNLQNVSDDNVMATLLRHGNFDYISQTTVWDPTITDQLLPDSYYLSSKPTFFGSMPWPSIGPDLDPIVGNLPARERFISLIKRPAAPNGVQGQ